MFLGVGRARFLLLSFLTLDTSTHSAGGIRAPGWGQRGHNAFGTSFLSQGKTFSFFVGSVRNKDP